ncbi:MAG: PRC-barrel domain-containing protein [Anaerolineae bacterium]|nr:PRC-barrel domain-containing protein [Anaerolineae bacterium]
MGRLISARFMTQGQLQRCCADGLSPEVVGCALYTSDNRRVGVVKDILVDDELYIVRYVVVDTTSAEFIINHPEVLLVAANLCCWDREQRTVRTEVTASDVQSAPFYDHAADVAQAYEETYIFHYGERPSAPADH